MVRWFLYLPGFTTPNSCHRGFALSNKSPLHPSNLYSVVGDKPESFLPQVEIARGKPSVATDSLKSCIRAAYPCIMTAESAIKRARTLLLSDEFRCPSSGRIAASKS